MSNDDEDDHYILRRMSQIMLHDLDQLRRREIEFGYVVDSLKSYVRSVAEKRPSAKAWNDEIFDLWITLETIAAVASANEETQLSAHDTERVEEVCDRVREMIAPLAGR